MAVYYLISRFFFVLCVRFRRQVSEIRHLGFDLLLDGNFSFLRQKRYCEMRAFWRMYLKIFRWKIVGKPPELDKFVIIVGPHTSYVDFIIGVAVRSATQMKTHYLGKKELFQPPFGFIFRKLGGYPVDRRSRSNMVEEVAKIFDTHEKFSIALAPEGTRRKVEKLKTGFYHIALKANVPLAMAALDFGKRQILFSEAFDLTGNKKDDFQKIFDFFKDIKGKRPEMGMNDLKIELI